MIDLEPYRREVRLHCYRLTGSLFDAEDMVQETFLRAWKALPSLREASLARAWLYRIATNVCLSTLDRRRRMPEQLGPPTAGAPGDPDRDTPWLTPFPWEVSDPDPGPEARYEEQETVRLAFATALQQLPPRQRAVLLLRDVLDWSARETAQALETTPASVNSALQRARSTLARSPVPPHDPADPALLSRYVSVWQERDMDGLLSLLARDVTLAMPPFRAWYQGREGVRGLLEFVWARYAQVTFRLVPVEANGQPGFAHYTEDRPHVLHVLRVQGGEVADLRIFHEPRLFPHFVP